MTERSVATNVAALLAWIDELGKLGLDAGTGGFDGQSLNEIGIANGSLTIDDRRGGYEWKLTQISLNLNRPKARRRGAHRSVGEPGAAMGAERGAVAGAARPPAAAA